jgi:hypothetical protein
MMGFTKAGEKLLLILTSPFLLVAAVILFLQSLADMASNEREDLSE